MSCTTVRLLATKELLTLLLKRYTDSGGNKFAKILKQIVSAASCVDELRLSLVVWLRHFTPYLFHPNRSTLWDLSA
jgi:hypothetical protein